MGSGKLIFFLIIYFTKKLNSVPMQYKQITEVFVPFSKDQPELSFIIPDCFKSDFPDEYIRYSVNLNNTPNWLNFNQTGAKSVIHVDMEGDDFDISSIFVQAETSGEATLYVGGREGLHIFDISDRSNPVFISLFPSYWAVDIFVEDRFAYIADGDGGFRIINVFEKQIPREIFQLDKVVWGIDVVVDITPFNDDFAYLVCDDGFYIYNVENKFNATYVGSIVDHPELPNPRDVKVVGEHAYIADREKGLRIIDIRDKTGPQLLSGFLPPGTFGEYTYNLFIEGNYAFVGDGGIKIIDVSNKENQVEIGNFPHTSYAFDVFIKQGYAFVASHYGGIRIYDVKDLETPVYLEQVDSPNSGWSCGSVFAKGNHIYGAYGGHGFKIISFSGVKLFGLPNGAQEVSVEIVASALVNPMGLNSEVFILNVVCALGWVGENCSEWTCNQPSSNCYVHGECVGPGHCECDNVNWDGDECQNPNCVPPCSEHATCIQSQTPSTESFSDVVCSCERGWSGPKCLTEKIEGDFVWPIKSQNMIYILIGIVSFILSLVLFVCLLFFALLWYSSSRIKDLNYDSDDDFVLEKEIVKDDSMSGKEKKNLDLESKVKVDKIEEKKEKEEQSNESGEEHNITSVVGSKKELKEDSSDDVSILSGAEDDIQITSVMPSKREDSSDDDLSVLSGAEDDSQITSVMPSKREDSSDDDLSVLSGEEKEDERESDDDESDLSEGALHDTLLI